MPFGPLLTPSLALSTFKPILEAQGHQCSVRYCNIEFSQEFDAEIYHLIASGLPRAHDLAGEFIFSRALFHERAHATERYVDYLKNIDTTERTKGPVPSSKHLVQDLINSLPKYRELATSFIIRIAREISQSDYHLVGLTSAFQQNTASLALARMLKLLRPEIPIIIGGANVEGQMGKAIFQNFPFIDSVVIGEGEQVLVDLIRYYLEEGKHPKSGAISRAKDCDYLSESNQKQSQKLVPMDLLPTPDYSDFMSAVRSADLPHRPQLLFETSRGCWWGEKHHCTFCGLNGATMAFRSKSSDVAFRQITEISEMYPGLDIGMTDNIMDHKYIRDFIPRLAASKISVSLFYEMKANLKKEAIAALASAGVRNIQPGVESFSDQVLKLMDKGVSGLQNIQLLKWCAEHGVTPHWNFLLGFPGERSEEYNYITNLVPLISHLQPPRGVGRLRIDRFSPYFKNAGKYFTNMRPFEAYKIVYSLEDAAIADIAYFFDGDPILPDNPQKYTTHTVKAMNRWKTAWNETFLFFLSTSSGAVCCDSRFTGGREMRVMAVGQIGHQILIQGDRISSTEAVTDKLCGTYPHVEVEEAFDFLVEERLVISQSDKFLTLAIPVGSYYPDKRVSSRIRGQSMEERKNACA